jgi:putative aldouronate transport system substrate-binding protein
MESKQFPMTRRDFLRFTAIAAGTTTLAACAAPAPQAGQGEGAVAPAQAPIVIRHIEAWFSRPSSVEVAQPVMEAISRKAQEEGLNIQREIIILDDHEQKYPVLYAAGEDFVSAFDAPWRMMPSLIEQGYLLPVETLFDSHMPHVKELITPQILDANYLSGHIYGLPIGYYYGTTSGVITREDLRQRFGAPEPTVGIESLEPFMQACKVGLGDDFLGIPMFHNNGSSIVQELGWKDPKIWYPPVGQPQQWGIGIPDVYSDLTLQDIESLPEKRAMFDVQRRWYENEWSTREELNLEMGRTHEQVFYPGRCVAMYSSEPDYNWYNDEIQLKAFVPDGAARGYDLSGHRAGAVTGWGTLRQWNYVVFNGNASEEKRDACLRWYDWMYSNQDNIDLWLFGIDGVNYNKEADLRYSEVEGVDPNRNYRHEWYTGGVPGKYRRIHQDLPQSCVDALTFMSTADNWDFSNPIADFVPDTKPVETRVLALQAAYSEAAYAFNLGSTEWDEAVAQYKETLDAAGRQEIKAEFQRQLDAWVAENPPA